MPRFKDGKKRISCPDLIVCEGRDAEQFIIWFLKYCLENGEGFDSFEVINGGGVDELPAFIKALPGLTNFSAVKTLSIIRDAERDYSGAVHSLKSVFKNAGFAIPAAPCSPCAFQDDQQPVVTGYALFPALARGLENGVLEDLCLSILAAESSRLILNIADETLEKAKDIVGCFTHFSKNRLHLTLSLTNPFVGLKLGEAAKAKAFNYGNLELLHFKNFLKSMLNAGQGTNNLPA